MIDQKPHEYILTYGISYKTLVGPKSLGKIWQSQFDKIDGFIRIHNETRYLVLIALEKYDVVYNRIKHLTIVKSGITIMQKSRLILLTLCLKKKNGFA